ncbi:MAG TPA: HAMP domain-containing sensor histidine kinase [Streptosporangiaceae bacterium]|nr:HAMP domain-containing sensor histidine kinase [Streptosporangiaceae bacterium]
MKSWRPRWAQLRTRVLAGVLAVTLIALVAFDFAAVTSLRGYLLNQTDSRLQQVLDLYHAGSLGPSGLRRGARPQGGPFRPRPPTQVARPGRGPVKQKVVSGPVLLGLPRILGPFYVGTVSGQGPNVLVRAGNELVPRLPAGLRAVAASHRAHTVTSRNGHTSLRLLARAYPGAGIAYATTSLSDVNKTVGQLELILIIGSAAAGLAAVGGAGWVMRRGLRPIETMANQADRITAGDLTGRVSPHDPGTEVGRLGAALNGMLTRIDADVHEREASQEATRQFFADASHELRTPLASLRANAELYQQGALPDRPQVDEAMRRITLEAERMSALADDMLRLARLDQHPQREQDPVEVTALVTECAARAGIDDPRRTWHVSIAPGLETTGDEELLRRAMDNLLANVSAHTPEGTVAAVTAAKRDGTVTVEVSDNGPGVPADRLPRIFDRFYRAVAPSQRPGSGLGLAIVSAVAAAHHGTAEATLNQPHGLRIRLTLPVAGQPRPAPDGQLREGSAGDDLDLADAETPDRGLDL